MRVISYLESSYWAMRRAEFDAMSRIAYSHGADNLDAVLALAEKEKPEAMLAKSGAPIEGTRYAEMRDGVAVLDINGPIAKRMSLFQEICHGGTSTERLLKDFQSLIENPNVSAIVLNIDSPGGEVFGTNEIAQAIYDARGKKPIIAYVGGLGASAAYYIASAADEIVCDKQALLGSIGIVTAWMDDKGMYEALGIRREVVTSSNAPLKRLNFDKPAHRAELQKELDSLENTFIKSVARNRKVTKEQVITDFNQGGVLDGVSAVKAKLADRTGSLEKVIKELQSKSKKKKSVGAGAEGDLSMSDKKTLWQKVQAIFQEEGISAPESTAGAEPVKEQPTQAVDSAGQNALKELAELKAQQAEAFEKQISADAVVFIESECKAGRMFPSEKEAASALFVQAAKDDKASPLAEGSRLDTLKAQQAKRMPHGLTDEKVNAGTNIVLLAGQDNDSEMKIAARKQVADFVATVTPKTAKQAS